MVGFLNTFTGFERADFDTYTPDKWSSNLHNLPRMRVKQKLESLAPALLEALLEAGVEVESEVSSERPSIWNQNKVDSQWLFLRAMQTQRRSFSQPLIGIGRSQTI